MPGHVFAVVENSGDVAADFIPSILRHDFEKPALTRAIRPDHCGEVAFAFIGSTDVREHHFPEIIIYLSIGEQLHRWNAKAFLVNLLSKRHRTGRHASDIRVVGATGHIEEELT